MHFSPIFSSLSKKARLLLLFPSSPAPEGLLLELSLMAYVVSYDTDKNGEVDDNHDDKNENEDDNHHDVEDDEHYDKDDDVDDNHYHFFKLKLG